MKALITALSLWIAGGLVSAPAEAHERAFHVTATPVAGLAVWGNSDGHHGQPANWKVGWSGAVTLGSLPVYPVPAYAVVPAPHAVHGPYFGAASYHGGRLYHRSEYGYRPKHRNGHKRGQGHGVRHARKHSHRHH